MGLAMAVTDQLLAAANDPYQAKIDALIRQLSQPDQPPLIPTEPPQSTGVTAARTGLSALGDILTAIGYSKRGRIPPTNFLQQLAAENAQNRAAQQENVRRTAQAKIEGTKTGAQLSLQDIQQKRKEQADAMERDYNKARDAAIRENVPVLTDKGIPKTTQQLYKDVADSQTASQAEKKARYELRAKEHADRMDLMTKNWELAKQREARLAAQSKGRIPRIDPATAKLYDQQWELEKKTLDTLTQEQAKAAAIFDQPTVDRLEEEIKAQNAKMQGLMIERFNVTNPQGAKVEPKTTTDSSGFSIIQTSPPK